jgi:DNA (cytosine-5)-methyltransferase 1
MENVPQLLESLEHGDIIDIAETMGFKVWGDVLCADDYGVPQTRCRAFIIGCRDFDPALVFPPRRTPFDPSKGGAIDCFSASRWKRLFTRCPEVAPVRDAIADLPPLGGTEIRDDSPPPDLHFGRPSDNRNPSNSLLVTA